MARYDRIAPLQAPTRDKAFPAWLVLRDIEGNDRDGDAARRARLRFLALRPLRRLLDRNFSVTRESYLAQIEAVREELGYLPARDVERARLARFLHNVEERDPARAALAAVEMAEGCLTAGHTHGAEEYAHTALGLARSIANTRVELSAELVLAHCYRDRGEWAEADAHAARAVSMAETSDDRFDIVRARSEQAMGAAAQGHAAAAHSIFEQLLQSMKTAHDRQAEALCLGRLCACELQLGNASKALEHGWAALRGLDDLRERTHVLENVGSACAQLGLHKAAERCFGMVAQRGVDAPLRARARAAQAAANAAAGSSTLFRDRRQALLNDPSEYAADPRIAAFVQLELGRGCVLVGDMDYARDHLRAALATARQFSLNGILAGAESVLAALEKNAVRELAASHQPPESSRRIAEQLEALTDLPVPAL